MSWREFLCRCLIKLRIPLSKNVRESFQRGVAPGAFLGALIGLAPGMLLFHVLGGGQYYIGLTEVLGFIAMSMLLTTVAGALVGGAAAGCSGSQPPRLRKFAVEVLNGPERKKHRSTGLL